MVTIEIGIAFVVIVVKACTSNGNVLSGVRAAPSGAGDAFLRIGIDIGIWKIYVVSLNIKDVFRWHGGSLSEQVVP